jgi:hypothetical protein
VVVGVVNAWQGIGVKVCEQEDEGSFRNCDGGRARYRYRGNSGNLRFHPRFRLPSKYVRVALPLHARIGAGRDGLP